MLELEIVEAGGRRTITVETLPFSIGRSSENHLQLSDAQVSRKHAEITEIDGGWRIRDCGSRFGTYINEQQIQEAGFGASDKIRIGQTELLIYQARSSVISSGSVDFHHMNALLAGLRALGSSGVVDEVLAIVLDSALEVAGAERGFILLPDKDGRLELMVARGRGHISLPQAQTSRRIPDEVFATGRDKIVTDLQDEAHAAFHTGTVALGIRHVMCTPLHVTSYGTQSVTRRIGVLYLDSRERGYLQQVGILHALAAEAAVVIENARLYREVVDKERAEHELKIAAQIQNSLLPPPEHECRTAQLAALTTPCRSVGGDFFDYVTRSDDSLTFAVGDVAGKGTSAALLTAVVQGLLAGEAETTDEPAKVLSRVNRALCRRNVAARFVTAFYGHVGMNGRLQYCNAGHNPPFLMTASGSVRLETGGCVLGLFDHAAFETGEVEFHKDDLLVLFSDGVTEAENAAEEEFGDDRLAACVNAVRSRSAADVRDAVQKAVLDFAGATLMRDDVTLLVLRGL